MITEPLLFWPTWNTLYTLYLLQVNLPTWNNNNNLQFTHQSMIPSIYLSFYSTKMMGCIDMYMYTHIQGSCLVWAPSLFYTDMVLNREFLILLNRAINFIMSHDLAACRIKKNESVRTWELLYIVFLMVTRLSWCFTFFKGKLKIIILSRG